MTIMSQFANMTSSSIFCCHRVCLVKLVTGPGFYVNITTGSGVMEIFVCSGLTRNQEFRNTPVKVLPNICRMGQIRDTKFGTNVSNEKLLNLSKC